jgi:predicted thioesterase
MAGPSTSCSLTEVEQIEFLHEILGEESISKYSLDNGSEFDIDHTQLVTPGTHVTVIVRVTKHRKKSYR